MFTQYATRPLFPHQTCREVHGEKMYTWHNYNGFSGTYAIVLASENRAEGLPLIQELLPYFGPPCHEEGVDTVTCPQRSLLISRWTGPFLTAVDVLSGSQYWGLAGALFHLSQSLFSSGVRTQWIITISNTGLDVLPCGQRTGICGYETMRTGSKGNMQNQAGVLP